MISRRDFLTLTMATAAGLAGMIPRIGKAHAPVLHFGYAEDNLPMSARIDDGEDTTNGAARGILVDAIRLLSDGLGVENDHQAHSWARIQRLFDDGELNALCTNETDALKEIAVFSKSPIVPARKVLIHRKDDTRFEGIGSMSELQSFNHSNYSNNSWVKGLLPDNRVQWVMSPENALKMIATERADVFVADEIFGKYRMQQMGLTETLACSDTPLVEGSEFKICIRKDVPDALSLIQSYDLAIAAHHAALAQIKDDWVDGRRS